MLDEAINKEQDVSKNFFSLLNENISKFILSFYDCYTGTTS